MSHTVEVKPSEMKVVFYVVGRIHTAPLGMFNDYQSAEKFCWDFKPSGEPDELQIQKRWVPK